MLLGYARVSSESQNLDSQIDALLAAGVASSDIHSEKMSGVKTKPQLDLLLAKTAPGDVIVVYSISRASRSLRELLTLVEQLGERGVAFRSIKEPQIDTSTAAGRLILSVFAALSEYEREMIRERCAAGIRAAKSRGVRLGRPTKLNAQASARAKELYRGGLKAAEIARLLGCGRSTVYSALELES